MKPQAPELLHPSSAAPPTIYRTISVVTPVLNEQQSLEEFCRRTVNALEQCHLEGFEVIFVDDGSTDATPALLQGLMASDPRVKVLTLSRNFGHHPAVFAGLAFASGDLIAILDVDLQDPPELIPKLVAKCQEGHQLVFARRQVTDEAFWMRCLKGGFRTLMRRMSHIGFPDHVGVFSVMTHELKDLLLRMPERERYLVAMQMYLGFRVGYVEYVRAQRQGGSSKQSLGRLFRLGMNSLFAYSSLPLRLSMMAGLLCLGVAIVAIGIVLYHKLVLRVAIPGWTSVMIAILGMGAIQLLSLWVICEYVDRIFENTKGRPYYIVWKQEGARGIPEDARMSKGV